MGTNEILGLKSISDHRKEGIGATMKNNLKASWYFEKWYEKLILIGLCILGGWKLFGMIF
jgi:hypothetical protein